MKIALDMMGGDFAPAEAIKGVQQYLQNTADTSVHLVLIGDEDAQKTTDDALKGFDGRYTWVLAPQIIGMHEHPTKALKDKPESSIAMGFGLLQLGRADAFISAGNTGAMMVGAMYSVKTIEGILRPTIATPLPKEEGFNLLLDVGINADCKPEHLVQFSELGSIYMKQVGGLEDPRVGLLNLGEEEGKGNILAQTTYPLLKENTAINFVGNVEGRDVFLNKCDVVVCEGFVGNIVLKVAESAYEIFKKQRGIQDDLLEKFNYEVYGGTPILGINSPVIIGHGISSALAFNNIIDLARRIVASDLINAFKEHFAVSKPAAE
jgi:glycerol-3-phosphate acyltransferase PlsX